MAGGKPPGLQVTSLSSRRFTRYDFVACDKLMTDLRHKLFRVDQIYNSLTTVIYVTKNVVAFLKRFKILRQSYV